MAKAIQARRPAHRIACGGLTQTAMTSRTPRAFPVAPHLVIVHPQDLAASIDVICLLIGLRITSWNLIGRSVDRGGIQTMHSPPRVHLISFLILSVLTGQLIC
jgi:hypothetical protein